ncbi:hypothetical protein bcgnr5390_61700 [Bacillus luti]|nr:hypothetical protein BC2903_31120 [Bacillus cereus]
MRNKSKYPFDLEKTCRTCEFNFRGICAGGGELEYGQNIDDFKKVRACWSIGLDYFIECEKKKANFNNPDKQKNKSKKEESTSAIENDLKYKEKSGMWRF